MANGIVSDETNQTHENTSLHFLDHSI